MPRLRFPRTPCTGLMRLAALSSLVVAACSDGSDTQPVESDLRIQASAASAASDCRPRHEIAASKVHHVTPTGSARAAGGSFDDALDLATALTRVQPGELILLQPGTYAVPYTANARNTLRLAHSGTAEAPISIAAAGCGRAVLDFSFPEQAWVQDSFGLLLSGDHWYLRGIEVTRAGYQGVYVTGKHNTFDSCSFHDNRNSGLEINKGGAYTTVINSDAYRNYDPKKLGGMADGFASKQTQGPGNRFVGCRAWENSDDGYDTFDSAEVVLIEDSWAFDNGVDVWKYGGFAGNGNGFKVGGNEKLARNRLTRSVAFGNRVKGFDQNHNVGGITLYNCLAYRNGINFGLGGDLRAGEQHELANNISLGAPGSIENARTRGNSWEGLVASPADFVSLDLSQARLPRNPDGTLPSMSLFRLSPGSGLIDVGVDVGLPFHGAAPDLGPFESE